MDARLPTAGTTVPPDQDSERVARAARAPRKPIADRPTPVLLLDPDPTPTSAARPRRRPLAPAAGHLLLYRDELVLAADRGDDATRPGPTFRALPATEITHIARADRPRVTGGQVRLAALRVATGEDREWRFEAVRPGATLADLRQVYLGGPRRTP